MSSFIDLFFSFWSTLYLIFEYWSLVAQSCPYRSKPLAGVLIVESEIGCKQLLLTTRMFTIICGGGKTAAENGLDRLFLRVFLMLTDARAMYSNAQYTSYYLQVYGFDHVYNVATV